MNGFLFLFEFQSRKDAEHILMGDWRRQGQILKLDWWTPTTGALPESFRFNWFWVRIMGLPFHLWNSEIMKRLGDVCRVWLENKEESELKNHLRWARIRVKGPRDKIPASIKVGDGHLVYTLPVWCELPATYQRHAGDVTRPQVDRLECRPVHSTVQYPEVLHENGKRTAKEGNTSPNICIEEANTAVKSHMSGKGIFQNYNEGPSYNKSEWKESGMGITNQPDVIDFGPIREKPNASLSFIEPNTGKSSTYLCLIKILKNFLEPFTKNICFSEEESANTNFVMFEGERENRLSWKKTENEGGRGGSRLSVSLQKITIKGT